MALTLDSTSNSGILSTVSSATWSHTCSGNDRILVVGTATRDVNSADGVVTGITYNSVALTKIRSDVIGGVQYCRSELWYLIAPDTGAHDIVVTLTASTEDVGCGAISLNGAVQSASAIDANNGSNAAAQSSPQTTSVTTIRNGCWVIDSTYNKVSATDFAASQTEYFKLNLRSLGDWGGGSYVANKNPPGSQAMTWTYSTGADDYAHSVVSIAPMPTTITGLSSVTGVSSMVA